MWGFESDGEFFEAIKDAGLPGRNTDERLLIGASAANTAANEGVGQEGGFAVPPDISTRIRRLMLDEDSFLPMTDQNQVRGNSMRFPADETTPWGTSGVRVYWEQEGAKAKQTQPVLEYKTLRLHKLLGMAPVTDELLEDAPAMASYLRNQLGRSLRWPEAFRPVRRGRVSRRPKGYRTRPLACRVGFLTLTRSGPTSP